MKNYTKKNNPPGDNFDWDYMCRVEKDWKQALPKHTPEEWLRIFPEVKEIIPEKLAEAKKEQAKLEDYITRYLEMINSDPSSLSRFWMAELMKLDQGKKLVEFDQRIAELRRYIYPKPTFENGYQDYDIEQARGVPVDQLVGGTIRQSGNRVFAFCPFHQEKTPSFCIYEENSWYCFGCGVSGANAIDFVMKRDKKDFKEAVFHLIGGPR